MRTLFCWWCETFPHIYSTRFCLLLKEIKRWKEWRRALFCAIPAEQRTEALLFLLRRRAFFCNSEEEDNNGVKISSPVHTTTLLSSPLNDDDDERTRNSYLLGFSSSVLLKLLLGRERWRVVRVMLPRRRLKPLKTSGTRCRPTKILQTYSGKDSRACANARIPPWIFWTKPSWKNRENF